MKRIVLLLVSGMLLAGCKTVERVPVYIQNDSIRTEVKTVTQYVKDTLLVPIPAQTAERTTADSMSTLENDYAISEARINADGTLYHTLETKPQDLEVEFDKPVQRTDSTTTRTGTTTEVRTVEVERELTWWQQTQLYGFRVLVVLIVVWLVWKYKSNLITFIRKLI